MLKRDASTLLHRFYLWMKDSPDSPMYHAMTDSGDARVVTVSACFARTHRIASALQASGLQPGDNVAIYASNSPERIEWELGIILARGVVVSITPNSVDSEVLGILQEVAPKHVVIESFAFEERLQKHSASSEAWFKNVQHWIRLHDVEHPDAKSVWDELWIEQERADHPWKNPEEMLAAVQAQDTAWIIYTSGTTGKPKGAMLSLDNITFATDRVSQAWNLPFGHGTLFSFLPLSHVAEKLHTLGVGISNRYEVHICSSFDHFSQELKLVRPTLFLAVPRVWERMREEVMHKLDEIPRVQRTVLERAWNLSLSHKILQPVSALVLDQIKRALGLDRVIIAASGAAKLSESVALWYAKIGLPIHEVYGMTESSGIITLSVINHPDARTVGIPAHGVDVDVALDGEIKAKGRNVFQGYYKNPEETAATLVDGWLRTGDLGEWTDSPVAHDRHLKIVGREREILKLSTGRMVSPVPIEFVLKEMPEISQVCLIGDNMPSVTALFTLKEPLLLELRFVPGAIEGIEVVAPSVRQVISNQLKEINRSLSPWERVKNFVILSRDFTIEEQELTPTLKLRRARIAKNFEYQISTLYS